MVLGWTLGWALITGALTVHRPLLVQPLSQVHAVAHDIGRALSIIDRSAGKPVLEGEESRSHLLDAFRYWQERV